MSRKIAVYTRICGWSLGAAALTACPGIGYVYTDPADSYDPPDSSDPSQPPITTLETEPTSEPTTTGILDTTGQWTTNTTTLSDPVTSEPFTTGPTTDGASVTGDTDTTGTTGMPAVCGNGVVEGDEACDDGNQDLGDGCEPDCTTTPVCGNGVVEGDELCDDGNNVDGDSCSADCSLTADLCGNGMIEDGEVCDDGNEVPGDGCEPDCTVTSACGNGVIDDGEPCDDGNQIDVGPDDLCTNACEVAMPMCTAPVDYVVCDAGLDLADKVDASNALRALGVCNDLPDNSVQTTSFQLTAAEGASWQVARAFGSFKFDHDEDPLTPDQAFYGPREGDALLMLSTGKIAAPDGEGTVLEAADSQITNNDNGNDDADGLPPPFDATPGSNGGLGDDPFHGCDGVHDCSDSLSAEWQALPDPNDAIHFTLSAIVPDDVFGYTVDVAFCSSEWPSQINQPARDLFVVWQSDPSAADPTVIPTQPFTGNVAYLPDPFDPARGLPLTVKSLHPHFLGPGFVFAEPQLAGTGFEQHACSTWMTVRGGVRPGAEMTLGVLLADRGDSDRATVALLDNFRWDCAGCLPDTVSACATTPIVKP